jgi:glycerophosphoryl diester phosphodiesterase
MMGSYPKWIAHRGAGSLAPENTLAAFRVGASFGYVGFECDVKLSRDGVPFLLHDSTLERTTNGAGLAGALDWAALSQLDAGSWHSAGYAGEPLPTLEAVVRYALRNGFALNLEIKPMPGEEARTGAVVAERCVQWWAQQPATAAPLPLLSSFQPAALQAARAAAPSLPLALLLERWRDEAVPFARELACVALVLNHRLAQAERVAALHAQGLAVWVYTVNDATEAQRLLDLGVDGVITDAVDRLPPRG